MKKRKVVSGKNLAFRCPLIPSLVFWLVLDKLDAAGWVWGAVGAVMVVVWIVWIIDIWTIEQVEVFSERE